MAREAAEIPRSVLSLIDVLCVCEADHSAGDCSSIAGAQRRGGDRVVWSFVRSLAAAEFLGRGGLVKQKLAGG